jgi:predicted Na+-dependent transporter
LTFSFKMKQSKLESLIEAIVNTAIGFLITIVFLPIVNHICGIKMSSAQMTWSTILFTIISVARGYVIRRFFEGNIAKFLLRKLRRDGDK